MPMRRIVVPCAFQQCLSFGTVTLAAVRCLSASETITKNMPNKAVYFLAIDGFADWEPAHALAELRRHGAYRVEAVGLSREAVVSMGGLRVVPSRRIADVDPDDVAVFIMPGGNRWETMPIEGELESKLKELDARQEPIAAICAATVAIARIGLLRGRRHTSNGLEYLRSHVPGSREDQHYVAPPAPTATAPTTA